MNINFDQFPKNNNEKKDIKKDTYQDLVNDFGLFITLNASRLDQQILEGKSKELSELMQTLRKPIINGLNYSDFTFKYFNKLSEPEISKALITQIYNFIKYIEPRLDIFKNDSSWVKRFYEIKNKYINLVSNK